MAALAHDLELEPVLLDLHIRSILNSNHLTHSPYTVVSGHGSARRLLGNPGFFANIDEREVDIQLALHVIALRQYIPKHSAQEGEMTNYLALNTHDLAVMVGLGSFAGAASSVFWDIAFVGNAPTVVTVAAAAVGFAAGKVLSVRAAQVKHEAR